MIQDLITNDSDHLKALLARHGVYNHITVYTNEMLAVEYSILILASSINDLHGKVLIPTSYNLAECVLNGRIIRVDEVTVNKLNCETAFACCVLSHVTSMETTLCSSIPTDLLPTIAILRCFC